MYRKSLPRTILTILLLIGLPAAAAAQIPGLDFGSGDGKPIEFSVTGPDSPVGPGDTIEVKIRARLQPEWHVYATSMPDVATGPRPTRIRVTAPKGAELLEVRPDRDPVVKFEEVFQLQTEYFEEEVTWTLVIRMPEELPSGSELAGEIRYQLCTQTQCLPPSTFRFAVPLTVTGGSAPGAAGAPATTAEPPAGDAGGEEQRDSQEQQRDSSAVSGEIRSLSSALLFGFIAGLILNVMPCVLPVLSLKIYGFVQQSGQDPWRTRWLGLTFAAGVIFVFLILAGLAWALSLGWGQQFQSRAFVVAMVGLLVAFAMGLFDVYTIRLPGFVARAEGELAHEETYLASFMKGMLATVLATPCSGPFLGGVLTFAVAQPPPVIFAVFAAIGIGMASPYVLLAWFPGWARFLPKPGEWMNVLKEAMGFLLLGAALWLLWTRRHDGEFVLWTTAFGLWVGFACWLYGRLASPLAGVLRRRLAPAFALGTLALGWWVCVSLTGVLNPRHTAQASEHTGAAQQSGGIAGVPLEQIKDAINKGQWLEYRRELLDGLLRQGYSVIVDWTADW